MPDHFGHTLCHAADIYIGHLIRFLRATEGDSSNEGSESLSFLVACLLLSNQAEQIVCMMPGEAGDAVASAATLASWNELIHGEQLTVFQPATEQLQLSEHGSREEYQLRDSVRVSTMVRQPVLDKVQPAIGHRRPNIVVRVEVLVFGQRFC